MSGSNLDRYQSDLKRLIEATINLTISMQRTVDQIAVDRQLKEVFGDKAPAFIKSLPSFNEAYQAWYSEALAVVRQILPERVADFRSHYERPKSGRKDILFSNYVIEDFIQGVRITRYNDVVVDRSAALPRLEAQVAILKACKARFTTSLFDIRQLVQADLLDDELAGARELLKSKFFRAAGVVAGVVLERHLQTVAANHSVTVKARASLGDYIAALKEADIVETTEWRKLQHLSELRAKCTHNKGAEPTPQEVDDLISGANRTIKNLF